MLSDFMDRDTNGGHMETIHQTLRYLKFCKQDILILQILDKEERKPQLEGTVKLIDCETEQDLTVTMTSWLRKQYDNRLTAFQKDWRMQPKSIRRILCRCIRTRP